MRFFIPCTAGVSPSRLRLSPCARLPAALLPGSGRAHSFCRPLPLPAARPQDPSLRYAFRVVSPGKEYHLQAENEVEQQEWMQMLQVRHRAAVL